MLGLSNSLISNGLNIRRYTYTSDFTSGADNWEAFSVQGTLTLATNQTAPGSGEAGWLKGTFDTNQDNQSGIKISIQNAFGISRIFPGGYHEVTAKIYLDSPGDNDYWGGADDVATYFLANGQGISDNVTQEQVFSYSGSPSNNFLTDTTSDISLYWIGAGDRPAAGAVFYIKDIVWNIYTF